MHNLIKKLQFHKKESAFTHTHSALDSHLVCMVVVSMLEYFLFYPTDVIIKQKQTSLDFAVLQQRSSLLAANSFLSHKSLAVSYNHCIHRLSSTTVSLTAANSIWTITCTDPVFFLNWLIATVQHAFLLTNAYFSSTIKTEP